MSAENPEDLAAKVAELERKLDASLTAIAKLVKALDHQRGGDARFIFEMDLVKHSLNEAGYSETATSETE